MVDRGVELLAKGDVVFTKTVVEHELGLLEPLAGDPWHSAFHRARPLVAFFMVGWIKGLSEWWEPNAQLTEKDIYPHFWPNGTTPDSAEFDALVAEQFDHYRLRVGGLVEAPREFSFSDLKALPKQEQITTHFCIQGWSGVAKWGGVPMRDILDLVRPTAEARYAVFYSFADGGDGETFPASAEMPKITDRRLGSASVTRGNVAGSHTPGNNTPETRRELILCFNL
jgi:DMSO/TMAO reductase YedYZ molybdopterin-dependent catalytic subunit